MCWQDSLKMKQDKADEQQRGNGEGDWEWMGFWRF